jgi:hypothetical protein
MLGRGPLVATAAACGAAGILALAVAHCARTAPGGLGVPPPPHGLAMPMYHFDRARSGWSDAESTLVPAVVKQGLRRAWVTAPLDAAMVTCPGDPGPTSYAPRLYASPLYLDDVSITGGANAGLRASVLLAATTSDWAYAVAATDAPTADGTGVVSAGTVLWSQSLGSPICVPSMDGGIPLGVLGTPVVDLAATPPTEYVAAVDAADPTGADGVWRIFALDVGSGAVLPGWPVVLDPSLVSSLDVNSPVPGAPPQMSTALRQSQRTALALSPDGGTLYAGFGSYYDGAIGWMVSVDVPSRRVAASFSGSPALVPPGSDPLNPKNVASGGMWGAGGPAIASDGRVFLTTGNSPPFSFGTPRVWGNSLLVWTHDLALSATYTPFNYCLLDRGDTDLGGSSPAVFDVDPSRTSTPHLITFGSKQGVVYLVDRDHPGGSVVGRPPCDADAGADDPSTDTSLYGPAGVYDGGRPGPLPVFGPYSDGATANELNSAKMRTTPAVFQPASGDVYVFVSGNHAGPATPNPQRLVWREQPAVARLHVSLVPGQPAYLEPDFVRNVSTTLVNAGSPIVTSHDGGRDPVVWVLDQNMLRTDPVEPKPGRTLHDEVVHAFDGNTLAELWSSGEDDLGPGGKYGHVVVAHGVLYVGTDRLAAFVPR